MLEKFLTMRALGNPSGGSGGAQPDWNAADGEPGHILNRTHFMEKVNGDITQSSRAVHIGPGAYILPGYPVELIAGERYEIQYGDSVYKSEAVYIPGDEDESGSWVLGNIGAVTGGVDSGQSYVAVISEAVSNMPEAMFSNIQFLHLEGADDIDDVKIVGPHYRRKRFGTEWMEHPVPYCIRVRELDVHSIYYTRVIPYLAMDGDLSVKILTDDLSGGVLLRCTEYDAEKVVFENIQFKGGNLIANNLTVYADETPTEYNTYKVYSTK